MESDFVLASRSPRRLELLSLLVPAEKIRVVPPATVDEAGFDGLSILADIERRLASIAAAKCDDVCSRLNRETSIVIAADTVIVVGDREGTYQVLGQPPEPDWQATVRRWFLDHYAGRSHRVLTGLCVAAGDIRHETIATSVVSVRSDIERHLDRYLATGEPRGKAGGYAIQGLGSLFVDRVDGSLTNIVGLPVNELLDVLCRIDQEGSAPSGP